MACGETSQCVGGILHIIKDMARLKGYCLEEYAHFQCYLKILMSAVKFNNKEIACQIVSDLYAISLPNRLLIVEQQSTHGQLTK